ncbi:hypothetical protein HYH02_008373 [Chlamydomonas schloesseri]|uniref:Pherophorin domain-containing protein n=1 Tax=Chlamydomonas schloesseri TaxID=2026947 RepID=A0A836B425_9CHLO|nr:hypothetical protein HYH02_008373 [Chlamydomonas schloesseri]|eukprot:KAG2446813.1 hypothetical protein HYH02_008373 [Chlamydomonas schloesseri]
MYLYCQVCLLWPRPGSKCSYDFVPSPPPGGARSGRSRTASGGARTSGAGGRRRAQEAPAGPTMDSICLADRMNPVITEPGAAPSLAAGGSNFSRPWAANNASRYCQWVRWRDTNQRPQDVLFSIRGSNTPCAALNGQTVVTVRGMEATCSAPNYFANGTVAGCQGNAGNVYNECLWKVKAPRPGGKDWTGCNVCVPNVTEPMPPTAPSTPSKFKPPPPRLRPPATPSHRVPGFPYCACPRRSSRNTPFALEYANSTRLPDMLDGSQRYSHCFTLQLQDCNPDAYCCPPNRMDLKKIEFSVGTQCRSAVKLVLLDGMSVPWSMTADTYQGQNVLTWKLPDLQLTQQAVGEKGALSLCMVLSAPCTSIEDFCMGPSCRHSIFNTPESCCPVSEAEITYEFEEVPERRRRRHLSASSSSTDLSHSSEGDLDTSTAGTAPSWSSRAWSVQRRRR